MSLFARFATRRGVLFVGVVLAALISIPSLFTGYFLDDYYLLATLEGAQTPGTPLDLFLFSDGVPATVKFFQETGPFPWYMLPDIKLHFFRPLSSLTHVVDHALFPRDPFWQHMHSTLWYALLLLGVGLLYRRVLPLPVALLAVILFAVDEGHWVPAGWLSARNALVATAPAVLGLAAHLRWRETGWRWGLPLSLTGYATGLLAGETTLAVMAYLLAYEIVGARDTVRTRMLALTPGACLVAAYLLYYRSMNYGVHGSGIYLDPIGEPVAFLAAAPGRFLSLMGSQFFSSPSELSTVAEVMHYPLILTGTVMFAVVGVAWRRTRPTLDADTRRATDWLILGAVGSMIPMLATFPAGRLLLVPSIGFAAVIAILLHTWWTGRDTRPYARRLGVALIAVHLIVSPMFWFVMPLAPPVFDERVRAVSFNAPIDDTVAANTRYIVLNCADPATALYTPLVRRLSGSPIPKGWWALSLAMKDQYVTRTADNAFELTVQDGPLIGNGVEKLFRSPSYPFHIGEKIRVGEMVVEVLEVYGPWPRRIRCTFDSSLDDPRFQFLTWRNGHFEVFHWAPIGEKIVLPYDPGIMRPGYVFPG